MRIEHLERLTPQEIGTCDFSFDVECEVIPPYSGVGEVVAIAPYTKTYDFDALESCGSVDRLLAVAKEADQIKGFVLVSCGWNGFGWIDEFAVDRSVRRLGVGRLLMAEAVTWCRSRSLPGLRAETQSNNVPACRFYEAYGLRLGGFDRYLYSALPLARPEVALYWYLFL